MWKRRARIVFLGLLGLTLLGLAPANLPDFVPPKAKLESEQKPPKVKEEAKPQLPRPLPNPDDAVKLAWRDILTVPQHLRCYTRYLFIPKKEPESGKTASLALNYDSRTSGLPRPPPVADGVLLRVDLSQYAPRESDLKEWLQAWEELRYDPTFSLLITKDTLNFLEGDDAHGIFKKTLKDTGRTKRIHHPGGDFIHPQSGKRTALEAGEYDIIEYQEVESKTLSSEDVIRFDGKGIDQKAFHQLQEETHSLAPIVEHRYFKSRALTTIKDKGVFKTIFGGLYYDFKGIKKVKDVLGKDSKATDLDLFFENLGIGNIKGGLTADKLFDRLRSDQGAILYRSQVTGKPRDVWMFQTPAGKEGIGWGSITGDIKDEQIDIGDRQFANLLTQRAAAREAIFPQPSGLHIFALFNGDGALQDEVPFDIANDNMIPHPYTQRLQIFGCITCHSIQGVDGWQPVENQVKLVLKRLDIFSERNLRDISPSQRDIVDRIAGRYTGDFSKNITRARDDLAEYTLKATGPWKDAEDGQTNVCKLAAQRLHKEYGSFWWELVTPHTALQELGIDCPPDQALNLFRQILPPDTRVMFFGIIPEDPRIGALHAGIGIPRVDWALSYSFALERAQKNPLYKRLRGE